MWTLGSPSGCPLFGVRQRPTKPFPARVKQFWSRNSVFEFDLSAKKGLKSKCPFRNDTPLTRAHGIYSEQAAPSVSIGGFSIQVSGRRGATCVAF
eukprot:gene32-biopygen78